MQPSGDAAAQLLEEVYALEREEWRDLVCERRAADTALVDLSEAAVGAAAWREHPRLVDLLPAADEKLSPERPCCLRAGGDDSRQRPSLSAQAVDAFLAAWRRPVSVSDPSPPPPPPASLAAATCPAEVRAILTAHYLGSDRFVVAGGAVVRPLVSGDTDTATINLFWVGPLTPDGKKECAAAVQRLFYGMRVFRCSAGSWTALPHQQQQQSPPQDHDRLPTVRVSGLAFESVAALLAHFDLPASKVAFDGQRLLATRLGLYALTHRVNLVSLHRRSGPTYWRRLHAYAKRLGFAVLLPNRSWLSGSSGGGISISRRRSWPLKSVEDLLSLADAERDNSARTLWWGKLQAREAAVLEQGEVRRVEYSRLFVPNTGALGGGTALPRAAFYAASPQGAATAAAVTTTSTPSLRQIRERLYPTVPPATFAATWPDTKLPCVWRCVHVCGPEERRARTERALSEVPALLTAACALLFGPDSASQQLCSLAPGPRRSAYGALLPDRPAAATAAAAARSYTEEVVAALADRIERQRIPAITDLRAEASARREKMCAACARGDSSASYASSSYYASSSAQRRLLEWEQEAVEWTSISPLRVAERWLTKWPHLLPGREEAGVDLTRHNLIVDLALEETVHQMGWPRRSAALEAYVRLVKREFRYIGIDKVVRWALVGPAAGERDAVEEPRKEDDGERKWYERRSPMPLSSSQEKARVSEAVRRFHWEQLTSVSDLPSEPMAAVVAG